MLPKEQKSGCDHVVRTAPPLVSDEHSRYKRPLLPPFADAGRYPRTH